MAEIVLDTSTLILLAKLDFLAPLSKEVKIYIPDKVKEEATRNPELLDAQMIVQFVKERKIHVAQESEGMFEKNIMKDFLLGRGEVQALALAKEKGILLGIDDKEGIKVCKVFGLRFTTVLAFLVRFFERNFLTKEQVLSKLEKLKEYGWYQPELLDKATQEIGRRK